MKQLMLTFLLGILFFQTETDAQNTILAKTTPGQKIQIQVPEAQAKSVVASFRRKGYVPVFIDAFNHSTQVATNSGQLKTYFNFVFEKKNTSQYGVNIGAPFIVHNAGDERIIFLESYLSESGQIKFNIITRKNTAVKFKAVHVKSNQFQAKFNQMKNAGYHITTRTSVRKNGQTYVTALFEKSNVGGWISKPNLTQAQATALMTQYRNKGWVLRFMDIPNHTKKYNLIFHQKPSGTWYAQNGFSKNQSLNKISQAKNNGYKTTMICGYDKPGLINGNEVMKIKYALTFVK